MASAPPQTDVDNDDAEFQAEFQRLADGEKPSPSPEPPAGDEVTPEGNAPAGEPAPTPAPADPAEDGTSGTSAEGGEPSPEAQAPDPWKDVPDELRAQIALIEKERDDAKHRAKSDAERVAALSRKLASLSAASAPSAPAPEKKAEPTEAQKALDAKVAQLKEDYPEVAEPMLELLAAQRNELTGVKSQLDAVNQDRQARVIAEQEALLVQSHPDWREVSATEQFAGWLSEQPEGLQRLASSWDARETSTVLSLYKTEAAAAGEGGAAVATPAQLAADAKRRQQLEGGKETKSRPAPATSGPPDDFDAAQKYYAEKKDREMLEAKRR